MLKSACQDTVKSIERNNLMSFASIISVVAALLILGIFLIITMNISSITQNVVSSLEIKVFLKSAYTQQDAANLEKEMSDNPNVTRISFESKDEALEKYSAKLNQYSGLLSGFNSSNNPISDSYTVAVTDPNMLDSVKQEIEDYESPAVDYVKYGEEYVDVLVSFRDFMGYLCVAVMAVLTLISILIIYNTIKLTCYARRKEISIMKVIGADDWYIRLPFFFEGMTLGVLGAVVSTLILRSGYMYAVGVSDTLAYLPMNSHLISPDPAIMPIFVFSLVYGIVVGAFGSLFSIRKYLDA